MALNLIKSQSRSLSQSLRQLLRSAHYFAKVDDDVTILGREGSKVDVCVGRCEDLEILRHAGPESVGEVNLLVRNVTGDINIRRASRALKNLSISVENLEGTIFFPKKSFVTSDFQKPTSEWLQISVGKFDDSINEKFTAIRSRMKELSVTSPPGVKIEEVKITIDDKDSNLEDSTIYIEEAGDDIKILPRWNNNYIPQINVVVENVDDIEF